MKKVVFLCLVCFSMALLQCCFVNTAVPQSEILKNIRLSDNSSIGLLNFCNFYGRVENNNSFKIDNVKLKAFFYNKDTKQRTYHELELGVPVTANGSATYQQKTFVGKGVEIERVEVISAQKSY